MSVSCPWEGKEGPCERTFDTSHAMRVHHARSHGESLRFVTEVCENCGDDFDRRHDKDRKFCKRECWSEYQRERVSVVCEWCGTEEEVSPSYAERYRFCSDDCKFDSQKNRVGKTCPNCDRYFEVPKSQEHKYTCCSKGCGSDYRSGDNHPNKVEWESIICEYCGREESYPPSIAENRRFCRKDCFDYWQKETDYNSGENNPRWDRVSVECDWCGDPTSKQPSEVSELNFCNPSHHGRWMSENFVGENNPRWAGGVERDYGSNWQTMRKRALERDGFECQNCGVSNSNHYDKRGFGLDVHHLISISEFDSPEEANGLENLVSLCRDCHNSIEPLPEQEQRQKLAA